MMVNSQVNAHAVACSTSPSQRMNNLLTYVHRSLDSANKNITPLLDRVQMVSGVFDGDRIARTTITLHLAPAEASQLYQEVVGDMLIIQRLRNDPRVPANLREGYKMIQGIHKSKYGVELVLHLPIDTFKQKLAEFITDRLNKI